MEITKNEITDKNKKYTLFPFTKQRYAVPEIYESGEGIYIYDIEGNKYMDLASQYVNVNIGYGNEEVIQAAIEQMRKMHYCKPVDGTEIRGKFCEKLITEVAPSNMKKIFLTLGGSDANDSAVRIAKAVTGRKKIFSQYSSYHGATIGAANISGDHERIRERLEHPDYIHFIGYNTKKLEKYFENKDDYCDFLLEILEEQILLEGFHTIAAICFETISLGNIAIPAKRYYEGVRKLCDKYGILLIFDEVLVGFGRTGKWFACEHFNIQPDIMTFAKGVTSSYIPLGGVMVNERIANKLEGISFNVGFTCSFHPVACAVGYAVVNYMQREHVVENAEKVGLYLKKKLEEKILPCAYVDEIRGIGLLQAILLSGKMNCYSAAAAFCEILKEKGYVTWVDRTAILIAPPLIIKEEQIDQFVEDLRNIFLQLENEKYMEKIEFYPQEASNGAEAFYSLSYVEKMADILRDFNHVLILGSARLLILRIVLAAVQAAKKKYGIYVCKKIYEQLEEEKAHSIFFDGQRFDVREQLGQVLHMQKEEKYDCVLMPYGRDDQEWGNVYEVAKAFEVPIFLILKDGTIRELTREFSE